MLITTTAAAILVTITAADMMDMGEKFGLESEDQIVIHMDRTGSIEHIEGAERVNDDRALTRACAALEQFCEDQASFPVLATRADISAAEMVEYLEQRYGFGN